MYTGDEESDDEIRERSRSAQASSAGGLDEQDSGGEVSVGEGDRKGERIGGPDYLRWYRGLREVERQAIIMETRRKWWDDMAKRFRPERDDIDE